MNSQILMLRNGRAQSLHTLHRSSQVPRFFQRNLAIRSTWQQQRPPRSRVNRFFNSFSSNQVVYSIIGLNLAVFGLWQYSDASAKRFGDARLRNWLLRNFTVHQNSLSRPWTLLTACFSHMQPDHLLLNLISFYFLAPAVISTIGVAPFLSLYMLSGVGGSLIYQGFNQFFGPKITLANGQQVRRTQYAYANGASGSIYGTMAYFACLFPRAIFLLFFVIPAPAFVLVPGLFAWDLYSAFKRPNSGVASMGHVGGAMVGALYYLSRGRVRLGR